MKIISVVESKSEIVEVDGEFYHTYRRHDANNWEILMGESWEPEYWCKEVEFAYQKYKAESGIDNENHLRPDKQK